MRKKLKSTNLEERNEEERKGRRRDINWAPLQVGGASSLIDNHSMAPKIIEHKQTAIIIKQQKHAFRQTTSDHLVVAEWATRE